MSDTGNCGKKPQEFVYTERTMDGNTVALKDRVKLLEEDVSSLTLPSSLPDAHDLVKLAYHRDVIANNTHRTISAVREALSSGREIMRQRKGAITRIQDAVGASEATPGSDTGAKRRAMSRLVSATWGPLDWADLQQGQGIKLNLSVLEFSAAAQLAEIMVPNYSGDPSTIQRVEKSYDDALFSPKLIELELLESKLSLLEDSLNNKRFDIHAISRLCEIASYEARRPLLEQ